MDLVSIPLPSASGVKCLATCVLASASIRRRWRPRRPLPPPFRGTGPKCWQIRQILPPLYKQPLPPSVAATIIIRVISNRCPLRPYQVRRGPSNGRPGPKLFRNSRASRSIHPTPHFLSNRPTIHLNVPQCPIVL